MTKEGLVLASDSRTNAGFDQVNVCRKMHTFVQPGERVFVILTSGSLSISQSVITLLGADFDAGQGLAKVNSLYEAARIVGDCVRRVSDIDRASLERDSFSFNVHLLLGGQVKGQDPNLYLIYPQGNPLAATEDSLYLQLGECKYGRPILDRGIQSTTSLEVAAKYALLSLDATMRSNVTVGPPFDLLLYKTALKWIDIAESPPEIAISISSIPAGSSRCGAPSSSCRISNSNRQATEIPQPASERLEFLKVARRIESRFHEYQKSLFPITTRPLMRYSCGD
jgi:putative proteasome-type protease